MQVEIVTWKQFDEKKAENYNKDFWYDKNNINSASVLDQNGHIIGFTEYKDTSLPQFV